jgi:hypothetical protein
MPECKKVDFTIRTLDEHVMARLGHPQSLILSQRRRICAQVEKQGLSRILRETRHELAEGLSMTWFPSQVGLA